MTWKAIDNKEFQNKIFLRRRLTTQKDDQASAHEDRIIDFVVH